jgi:hypothetical protein
VGDPVGGPRVRDNLKVGPVVRVDPPTITCGECGYSTPLDGHWVFSRPRDMGTISDISGAKWISGPNMTTPDLTFDTCRCGARFTGGVAAGTPRPDREDDHDPD